MSLFAIIVLAAASYFVFFRSSKDAVVALMLSAVSVSVIERLDIGPVAFPVYRLIVLVGLIRLFKEFFNPGFKFDSTDYAVIIFTIWTQFAAVFHTTDGYGFISTSGYLFNATGAYFVIRLAIREQRDVVYIIKGLILLGMVSAVMMTVEKLTATNYLTGLSGLGHEVAIRDGKVRASGAFRSPILAGSVGATIAFLSASLGREHNKFRLIGVLSGIVIVVCSASSSPILSLMLGTAVLFLYRYRAYSRYAFPVAIAAYILLDLVMKRPAYFIIAEVDLVGGSTGWHRARLVQAALENYGDWWLIGTTYTKHWMISTLVNNDSHIDITNYFIFWGVIGGIIPLLSLCYIVKSSISKIFRATEFEPHSPTTFMRWAIIAAILANVATAFSVSFFDQSCLFFWLPIALATTLVEGKSEPAQ